MVLDLLHRSVEALETRDHAFFMGRLGLAESWRAFPDFRRECVYLDIETDGGRGGNAITTVGLYDGEEYRCLIKGKDLQKLPEILGDYRMIVTFFGSGFDIPMVQKKFRTMTIDQLHLDLCPTLRRLGIRGGLKAIERTLGLERGDNTAGLGGMDAIRLWNRYKTLGDDQALETLVAYNREDVVNLEYLANYAYDRLKAQTAP
jgi:uncharacterized protein YprB with RNaseH-like and TPR domain